MAAKREAKKNVKRAPKAKAKTKAKRKKAAPKKAAKKRAAPKKAAKKRAAPPKAAKKKAGAKSKAAPKRASKKRAPSKTGKRAKRAALKRPVIARPAEPVAQPKPAPVEVEVEPAAARAPAPSTPPSVKEAVDSYMEGLPHGALASQLRKILTNAASGVDEAIKWAHADYQDPNGILQGATEKVRRVKRLIKPD